MKTRHSIQYTIRSVPAPVDRALRKKAMEEGRSLNEVALEALEHSAGLSESNRIFHDLDQFIGTWVDDPAIEEALRDQDQVDPSDWQ